MSGSPNIEEEEQEEQEEQEKNKGRDQNLLVRDAVLGALSAGVNKSEGLQANLTAWEGRKTGLCNEHIHSASSSHQDGQRYS